MQAIGGKHGSPYRDSYARRRRKSPAASVRTSQSTSAQSLVVTEASGAKAVVMTDPSGVWRSELPPGKYDLIAFGGLNGGELKIAGVNLHPGEQSFGEMRISESVFSTTDGEIVMKVSLGRQIAYVLRHPIPYIAYLSKRYL